MEITFLLGAGVSMAVGMPSTKELTDAVLASEDLLRLSNQSILYDPEHKYPSGGPWDQRADARKPVCASQAYLGSIRDLMADLVPDRFFSYEDIYYVAQALENEAGDPLARLFWERLVERRGGRSGEFAGQDDAGQRIEALLYMQGAVAAILAHHQREVADLGKLSVLIDAARDREVQHLHIFTLNHHCVLENHVASKGIQFFSGLGPLDGNVRWLDLDGYEQQRDEKLLIVKLHGSIDWFWFGRRRYGVCSAQFPRDASGTLWRRALSYPRILVGTANKAQYYQETPFPELFCLFRSHLERTDTLIVCGHSFGDAGIRAHLTNWAIAGPGRRLFVVDPNARQLMSQHLGMALPRYSQVYPIEKDIGQVDWGTLKALTAAES